MKKLNLLKLGMSVLSICIFGCASSTPPVSHDAERERAAAGYAALNAETNQEKTFPAANQSDLGNQTMPIAIEYSKIGRPVFMVVPAETPKGMSPLDFINQNTFVQDELNAIQEYLLTQGYTIESLQSAKELEETLQMQQEMLGNDDIAYMTGLMLGADINIRFSGSFKNDMVQVEISAHETSTARLLGTKTAFVKNNTQNPENNRYLVRSAVKKAMTSLEKTIYSYWINDLQKGVQYKVLLRIGERFEGSAANELGDEAVSLLRSSFKSVQINAMTVSTLDLTLYVDSELYPDGASVYNAIQNLLLPLASVQKTSINHKLIVAELQ